MHIAFLNPQGNFDPLDRYWTAHPDFGGQLVYVKEVALALGRMGHRVDILTRQVRDPEWPGLDARLEHYHGEPNVRIVRLPCGDDSFLHKEALWPWLGTQWVPEIAAFYAAEGHPPDAVTAHYGDGGLAAALWQTRYGGPPFTFTAHSLGAQKLDGLLSSGKASLAELDAKYAFSRRIGAERVAMAYAARIITSTEQEQREQYSHCAYAGVLGSAPEAIFSVIPPGVNPAIFSATQPASHDAQVARLVDRALARDIPIERRGLPAILCASRLEPRKNLAGLVRAFAQSSEAQAAANLLIVIHGSEAARSGPRFSAEERVVLDGALAICDAANLWGRVALFPLRRQTELAAAYRYLASRRSVFALTSLYEPFGLAPLEAMAAGLPVVVTRNGGPAETLVDRATGAEYGVLVDPTSPADIARGLLRLLRSREIWERYRDEGMRHVQHQYTWERTATAYLETLQNLLLPGPASPSYPIHHYYLSGAPSDAPDLNSLGWNRSRCAGIKTHT